MKTCSVDTSDISGTALRARQLTALLQNIFEHGSEGCLKNNELIGLAYNISAEIMFFTDQAENEGN